MHTCSVDESRAADRGSRVYDGWSGSAQHKCRVQNCRVRNRAASRWRPQAARRTKATMFVILKLQAWILVLLLDTSLSRLAIAPRCRLGGELNCCAAPQLQRGPDNRRILRLCRNQPRDTFAAAHDVIPGSYAKPIGSCSVS
jgi:hypothetical protein